MVIKDYIGNKEPILIVTYQLTCFILLDNVTASNGPPRIIPRSHIGSI